MTSAGGDRAKRRAYIPRRPPPAVPVQCSECPRPAKAAVHDVPYCLTCGCEKHPEDADILIAGVLSKSIFRDLAPSVAACAAALEA